MSHSVFVGNIQDDATEAELVTIFREVGPVVSIRLVFDKDTGKPKGVGFCEYVDAATALSAVRNLNGRECKGRPLCVVFAEDAATVSPPESAVPRVVASEGHPGGVVRRTRERVIKQAEYERKDREDRLDAAVKAVLKAIDALMADEKTVWVMSDKKTSQWYATKTPVMLPDIAIGYLHRGTDELSIKRLIDFERKVNRAWWNRSHPSEGFCGNDFVEIHGDNTYDFYIYADRMALPTVTTNGGRAQRTEDAERRILISGLSPAATRAQLLEWIHETAGPIDDLDTTRFADERKVECTLSTSAGVEWALQDLGKKPLIGRLMTIERAIARD